MISNAIPSLTEVGYIENKNVQMTKLFGYFMAADYSQCSLLRGGSASLKHILAKYPDPDECATGIKGALENLYGSYFDRVTVYVESEELANNVVNLTIEVICTDNDDGKQYKLSREIKTKEGNMIEFEKQLDSLYDYYKGQQK